MNVILSLKGFYSMICANRCPLSYDKYYIVLKFLFIAIDVKPTHPYYLPKFNKRGKQSLCFLVHWAVPVCSRHSCGEQRGYSCGAGKVCRDPVLNTSCITLCQSQGQSKDRPKVHGKKLAHPSGNAAYVANARCELCNGVRKKNKVWRKATHIWPKSHLF